MDLSVLYLLCSELTQTKGNSSVPEDGCFLGCSAVESAASIIRAMIIALLMEAARSSETLVNFYQATRRCNPEDSHLRIHRLENLKSYLVVCLIRNIDMIEGWEVL
jgi:hypothetical protein